MLPKFPILFFVKAYKKFHCFLISKKLVKKNTFDYQPIIRQHFYQRQKKVGGNYNIGNSGNEKPL
jgi:hypothetical protein